MALPKSVSKQTYFSLSIASSLSDINGFHRSPMRTPNIRLKNRLDEAWMRAEKKFNEDTKRFLGSYDIKTKDFVLRQLKSRYEAGRKGSNGSSARTDTLEKILNAIELVSAFAAQGVSIVFGPANLCFNAITFLIDAPRQISKAYDALQALFEEVERFLIKFRIYRRIEDVVGLANELCEDTNLLLMSFVKLCGIAIKVLQGSRWDAIKNGASIVLLKDDKIATAIEEFEALCHSSNVLANTVMLEHVLNSEADVKQILRAARRLEVGVSLLIARSNDEKTRIVNKDHLERIRRTLFYHPPDHEMLTPSIQENGSETLAALESTIEYEKWMTTPDMARSMLVLWGPPGSGKSYMLHTVKDNLNIRRECAGRVESSVYVAVHNFRGKNARTPKDERQNAAPIADVLKKIAFQVAVQSTSYAKELATLLSMTPNLRAEKDINKVWKALKLSELTTFQGATMYILFDSLERSELRGDLRKLLDLLMVSKPNQTRRGLKIRILLTMNERPDVVRTNHYFSVAINTINRKLVAAFAIEEMRRKDILQDIDKDTISLRQEIARKLMAGSPEITFAHVRQRLAALKTAIDVDEPYDELSNILSNHHSDRWPDSGMHVIQELQQQLSKRSVTLLNNILSFLLYAPEGCMSFNDLEAALQLGGFDLPIEPLAKKIRSQYNTVIDTNHNTVAIRPTVLSAFRGADRARQCDHMGGTKEPLVSMSIEINGATERTVKKFVWDLNEQMSNGRFDFSESNTATARVHKIHIDGLQAQLMVIRLCFKVLGEGWNEKTKYMLTYACLYLPIHLATLQEFASKINDKDKRTIGEGLMQYLTDPYHIKSRHETYGLGQWMYDDRAVDAIRFWLEMTRKLLPPREQRWIKTATDRSRGRLGFLQDLALILGEYWLTDIRSNCHSLFSWLYTYIEKNTSISMSPVRKTGVHAPSDALHDPQVLMDLFRVRSSPVEQAIKNESRKRLSDHSTGEDISSLHKIKRVAAWVLNHTKLECCDSLFLALGKTCLAVEEWETGIECYKRIHPDYTDRHYAVLGSAFCMLGLKNTARGLALSKEAFTTFRKLAHLDNLVEEDLECYVDSLKRMGEHFEGLGHVKEALSFYQEAFVQQKSDPCLHWRLLKLTCQSDSIQINAYTALLNWSEDFEALGCTSPAISLLEMTIGHDYESLLLPLCRSMRNLYLQNLFVQITEDAIQLVGDSQDTMVVAQIKYLQGVVHTLSSENGSCLIATRAYRDVLNSIPSEEARTWGASQLATITANNVLRSEFDNLRSRFLSDISLTLEEKQQLYLDFNDTFNGVIGTSPALTNYRGVDTCENFVVGLCSMIDMEEARRIYKKDMAQALEILIDNDEDNDAAGIYILCRIFCIIGDVVSALSAFSLYDRGITKRRCSVDRPREEPEWTMRDKIATGSVRTCTSCTKSLYSSDTDGVWWCRFCPNFELCNECKQLYASGALRLEKCSQSHVPLYIHLVHSHYTEAEVEDGMVKVDWERIDYGNGGFARYGGRLIGLGDWIEELRILWELPKPEGEGSRAQQ